MALPTFFTKLFSSYGNAPRIKESVTLPAQASQNGKFLKTDGTNTAWDSIPEYADATTSAHGLMSASDKSKLDGIGTGANVQSVNGQTGAVTIPTSTGTVSLVGEITNISLAKSGNSTKTFTGITPYKPVYIFACKTSANGKFTVVATNSSGFVLARITTSFEYGFNVGGNIGIGIPNSSSISIKCSNTDTENSTVGTLSVYQ